MTSTLQILIVDDETPARNRLRALLLDLEGVAISGEAKNGKEALELANQEAPDIVLMDIRMPKMDGIEAAGHLQKLDNPPAIIFTTAYDSYALQAFDLSAVDYLLKPIRSDRLRMALDKAKRLLPAQLSALQQAQPKRTHFSVQERGRVLLVPVDEVIYCRAELKYVTLRTVEREYLVEDSLNMIEQEFGAQFLRLHRNCLVAQNAILGYEKRQPLEGESHYVALLKGIPDTVAVSRRQQHLLKELVKG